MLGQVGARFERVARMEWRHCLVDDVQNTVANGYGPDDRALDTAAASDGASRPSRHDRAMLRAWASFYGLSHFPTFAEAAADTSGRFVPYRGLKRNNAFLDTLAYEVLRKVSYNNNTFVSTLVIEVLRNVA